MIGAKILALVVIVIQNNDPTKILSSLLLLIVIIILIGTLPYVFASLRSPGSITVQNSSEVSRVPTNLAPAEAFKAVIRFAQGNGYNIALIDEPNLFLCLEEPASLKSYGCIMPINVLTITEGGSVVEIGTKSKLQIGTAKRIGPGSSRSHEKCVSGIRAALFAAN